MKFLGTLPGRKIKNEDPMCRYKSAHSNLYGADEMCYLERLAGDKFYVVRPTTENIETTIQSWEQKKETTFLSPENKPFFDRALQFFKQEYGLLFDNCIAPDEELYSFIDYTKSPGFPGNYFHIRTKRELVNDPGYQKFIKEFHNRYWLPSPVYWTASPKREFKDKDEILINKIRMFQIPSFELLRSQLKFGKRVSLKMKNFKWSAYGFNPYGGGVDRLARTLLQKPNRFIYDISGWDKFLPIMSFLYESITQLLIETGQLWNDDLETEWFWTAQNTVVIRIKLPDGTVYEKDYGNPSGSGVTTRDNIFCHVMIVAYYLMKAYYQKYGEHCTFAQLRAQLVKLFGDDFIGSLDEEFDGVFKEGFMDGIFTEFGMKLKYIRGGYDHPLEDLEFLGFHFKHINGHWFPVWDVQRLASSFIYEDKDPMELKDFISKAYVLTMMSYPTDHFDHFAQAYKNLLLASIDNQDVVIQSFLSMGPVTPEMANAAYLGFESSEIFDFFIPQDGIHIKFTDWLVYHTQIMAESFTEEEEQINNDFCQSSCAWGETPQRFSKR